ncbi:MAG: PAS domain S-box protein [Phycisphaerae bacterium]|nr:PAS domain S-box protein [Phycisphaerae bacterium]
MRDSDKSKTQLFEELRSLRERLAAQERRLAEGGPVYAAMDGLFGGVFHDLRLILYRADHQAGRMEYLSSSAQAVLGLTSDDAKTFSEEKWLDRLHPDDRLRVRRARQEHFQRTQSDPGALGTFEARWRKTPAEWIWVRFRFLFVLDAEGRLFIETGTIEDVTDRRQTAAQLHELQHEHAVILDSVSELVVFHDLDMRIVWANRSAGESLGVATEELAGKRCHEVWHGRATPCEGCPVFAALRTKQPGEFEIATPDGRIWQVRGYPSFNDEGELIGVTEVARNVTETRKSEEILRRAHDELERRVLERTIDLRTSNANLRRQVDKRAKVEEALRQRERQFRTLAETVPTAVLIVQGDEFRYVNPATERISGYTREEIYASNFWDYVHPEYRKLVRSRAQARLRGEDVPTRYEMKFLRKDGSSRWLDASMSVLEYEGAPAILVAAMDITNRKEDEERLRDAHLQLLNAREEERRHLAGELHDSLAQDMVVLQLVLQCGAAALANTTVPQEWLTEATAMCTKMIGDVRRLSHGLYPPMLETLGLYKSLQSLAEQYEAAGKKVEIHWQGAEDRRYSRPVEITLFRIVQEAMSNAVRHGLADQAEIHVGNEGYSVVLEVIDNGRGFDVQKADKTGLGMRSMKDRLGVVDGRLDVTSEPGRTSVRVEIPGFLPEE